MARQDRRPQFPDRRTVADALALLVFAVVLVSGLVSLSHASPTPPPGAAAVDISSPTAPPTTQAGERLSVWDRAFSSEILDILRIGLVIVAAFALAGVTQRVVLGQYAFKAGPVELSAIDASAENVKDVVSAVERVKTETSDSVAQLKRLVDLTVATSGAESRQLREDLQRLEQVARRRNET
jgi:hypothetical protein